MLYIQFFSNKFDLFWATTRVFSYYIKQFGTKKNDALLNDIKGNYTHE